MKLIEIVTPNEEKKEETPSFFTRQAGPKLTRADRRKIKHKLRSGYVPSLLRKQAD